MIPPPFCPCTPDVRHELSDSGHFKTFQPIITTPNGHSALICSASISARLSLFCVLEKLSGHLCLKLALFGSMDNAPYWGWGYLVCLVLKWYLRTKQRNHMDTNSVSTCSFHPAVDGSPAYPPMGHSRCCVYAYDLWIEWISNGCIPISAISDLI